MFRTRFCPMTARPISPMSQLAFCINSPDEISVRSDSEDTVSFYSRGYNRRMAFFTRRGALAGAAAAFPLRSLLALPLDQIKLGVTTDEIDDDVEVAAKFLREHGLGWAEIRNVWGKYNTAQPMDK